MIFALLDRALRAPRAADDILYQAAFNNSLISLLEIYMIAYVVNNSPQKRRRNLSEAFVQIRESINTSKRDHVV